jgi:hypothetical protein
MAMVEAMTKAMTMARWMAFCKFRRGFTQVRGEKQQCLLETETVKFKYMQAILNDPKLSWVYSRGEMEDGNKRERCNGVGTGNGEQPTVA